MPRFSIVIPTRNGAETLSATLRTVLAVDYDDYEVVVCDNDTSDATRRLIEATASPRVRYVRPPQELSMSSNWELAVSNARGDYVILLGDDDALLTHSLREIERLQRQTGAAVVRWSAGFYLWPTIAIPGQNNYLRFSVGRTLRTCEWRTEVRAVTRFEKCYSELPMVYNSAIDRRVIDEVRRRAGRVFFARIPDIVSGLAVAHVAGTYVSTEVPMTIAGISRKSTGLGTLVTPNATGVDWHRLNTAEGFDCDPRVPSAMIFPTVPVAECFLAAKQRLFANDETLTLDRRLMLQHCVWSLHAQTRAEWDAAIESLRRSTDDSPELRSWFDAEVNSLEPRLGGTLPMRTASSGFDGRQLHLDTDQFGVTNVAEAAQLCERLLGYGRYAPAYEAAPASHATTKSPPATAPARADSTRPDVTAHVRMTSYAQNLEDVVLDRLFQDQPTGFYVDVGANDPVRLSVTKHFSNRGWRGINIEPGPAAYQRLCADRNRDVNLQIGVGSAAGELSLFVCPDNDALSTFSPEQAALYRDGGNRLIEHRVPIRTLADILREHAAEPIDFLSIDVEGFESEVLQGADLDRWRPRVIVVEATRPTTTEQTHWAWEAVLHQSGYRCAYFDGLNRFYLRAEDQHLAERIAVPPNVTDRFESHEMQLIRQDLEAKQTAIMTLHAMAGDLQQQLQDKHKALLDITAQLEDKHAALMDITRQLEEKHVALHRALDHAAKCVAPRAESTAPNGNKRSIHSPHASGPHTIRGSGSPKSWRASS